MAGGLEGRDLLGVDEVAEYLGLKPVTVYRWCREGRLPCAKLGRVWRIRRSALDDFMRRNEQPGTLAGQLGSFLRVPDHVIAVTENLRLLHRLDAAFFQAAEARDGAMVKFYAGETGSADELRDDFARNGLDARGLEAMGRMLMTEERELLGGRVGELRRALAERAGEGRMVWASFDWTRSVGLAEALREQGELAAVVDANQLVIKTAVLQRTVDEWPLETQRLVRSAARGTIWFSEGCLWLGRGVDVPRD